MHENNPDKPTPPPFFVGYSMQMPPAIRRWLLVCVPLICAAGGFAVGSLAGAQPRFSDSQFEFGTTTDVTGWVVADPYPALLVVPDVRAVAPSAATRVHLVGPGKFGAALDDFVGRHVHLSGTVIARNQHTMLEVVPGSVRATADTPPMPALTSEPLGEVTLTGEIVDAKCHLGVMKPGEGIAHRACAIRCLSGGAPPMLVTRDDRQRVQFVLLTDAAGQPLQRAVLPFVAREVSVRGALERRGDSLFLATAADGVTRL